MRSCNQPNEEILSSNEELQSTNEELNTVNEELHSRNDELSRVNGDLLNFLSTVDITILTVASTCASGGSRRRRNEC
jgi:two-component system CheB/CheR fusion protein